MAYSNNEVSHNFAHQTGEKRNGSNLFYEVNENGSSTIYSYGKHFGIAHILEPSKYGLNVCLFTLSDYSVTTSKHISQVSSAVSHFEKIFVPDEVTTYLDFNGNLEAGYYQTEKDIKYFNEQLEKFIKKHIRARKYSYEDEIIETVRNAEKYAELFNCKNKLNGKLRKIIHGKDEVSESDIIDSCLSDEQIESIEEKQKQKREAEKRKRKQQLKQFRARELNYLHSAKYTYLRLSETGENIETSKGIKISELEARKLWQVMKRAKETGETQHIEGRFAGFRIDEIKPELLNAGCHLVKFSEAERIAKKKGWV